MVTKGHRGMLVNAAVNMMTYSVNLIIYLFIKHVIQ